MRLLYGPMLFEASTMAAKQLLTLGSFKVVIIDTIIYTINLPIKPFFARNFD